MRQFLLMCLLTACSNDGGPLAGNESFSGVVVDSVYVDGHRIVVMWKGEFNKGGLASEHIREICPACTKESAK